MRVEEIIQHQKDLLDVEKPPSDLWKEIRDDWKDEPKSYSNQWWKVAAVIFISTSITLLIYSLSLQNKVNELASLGDISEEYLEIENQYKKEIIELESSTRISEVSQQDDFGWITEEMKTLEEINELYRKDIGQVPDQGQLVNALIDYYEKKIRLLKKLELEINRTQTGKAGVNKDAQGMDDVKISSLKSTIFKI